MSETTTPVPPASTVLVSGGSRGLGLAIVRDVLDRGASVAAFARTLTGSWGSSDRGGAWTLTGPAAAFGVGGGVGRMVVSTPGTGLAAKLSATTTATADAQVTVAVDRAPTGSGSYVDVVARRVPGAGGYRSTVRVLPDGSVTVALLRLAANGTVVATLQLTFIASLSRGGALRMQVEAVRVAASARSLGLGAALFGWAHAVGRSRGAVLSQLTTDRSRVDAHRFYERLGYEATHTGLKRPL